MTATRQPARVISATALEDFRLRLEFSDGTRREVDLADELWGPVFERIRNDPTLFKQARVDELLGTVVWPNGADLDPEVLHGDYLPADLPQARSAHQSSASG